MGSETAKANVKTTTAVSIRANIKMKSRMAKEYISGPKTKNTKVNGKMEKKMEKVT